MSEVKFKDNDENRDHRFLMLDNPSVTRYVLVIYVCAEWVLHNFARNAEMPLSSLAVSVGLLMGATLLAEAWVSNRGEVFSGCYFVAGLILIAESGYLVYVQSYLARIHR